MVSNVEFASAHSQFSSGKEIKVCISELVSAALAVRIKISAKSVLLI